jgi:uncharacterized protein (TIGR03083 family)
MTDLPYGSFTPDEYHAFIRAGAAQLRAGLLSGPEDAPVPTCPGWTLRDLVVHLGAVHEWAAHVVASGAAERPARPDAHVRPTDVLSDWYDERVGLLLDTLSRTDPTKACWTHQRGFRVAAYWSRRQAHELATHLVDAEVALGRAPHYDADLAVDGIGEVLDVWMPLFAEHPKRRLELAAPVALRSTDRPARWVLEHRPGAGLQVTGPQATSPPHISPDLASPHRTGPDHTGPHGTSPHRAADPGHADAPIVGSSVRPDQGSASDHEGSQVAVELRGRAADLLLALWKRVDLDQLTVEGDVTVARRFLASAVTP